MSIVAIGTVAYDSIETPFGKVEGMLGGSAMHFAAAASFFSPVLLAAVVGRDFDDKKLDFLKKRGVDLAGLKQCLGKTFHWSGRYGFDMNSRETLKTELGVIADFAPEIPPAWKNPAHLFLGNIHPSLQQKMLKEAGRPGKVTLDTMNLWIEGSRKELETVIGGADLMVLNEEEVRQLTGETSLVRAAKRIHGLGARTVVIKQGEYGALLFYKGEIFSAPGLPLEEVKDPTGAGDTFAGGLVGYLAKSGRFDFETLKSAVIAGSTMASFNVEDFGCRRLERLGADEVRARAAQFKKLAHFDPVEF